MPSYRSRLDRFISQTTGTPRKNVRTLLAQGRIMIDGEKACAINQQVGQFTRVVLDGEVLQMNLPVYLMLNKPPGVVSATRDNTHKTVIDFIDRKDRARLHIVGRLDYNSSGLVLLTNDGQWSRGLMEPGLKVAKTYRVQVENALTEDYIEAFRQGMYFSFENLTTQPASLRIISSHEAEVTLTEGRYHQIKRMFGRFQNRVLALHRQSVGHIQLDPELQTGQFRELSPREISLSSGNA